MAENSQILRTVPYCFTTVSMLWPCEVGWGATDVNGKTTTCHDSEEGCRMMVKVSDIEIKDGLR